MSTFCWTYVNVNSFDFPLEHVITQSKTDGSHKSYLNYEKASYYTSKVALRLWNSYFAASEKRDHRARLDFDCLCTGFYVGFMRRQMEEKHDWHVFIVNVRNSAIVPYRPASIFFSGHIF